MIDTYVKSQNRAALATFLEVFRNVIPPLPGRDAVAADDTQTPPVRAQPAAGHPSFWYSCVRTAIASLTPDGVTVIEADPAEGAAVVGVWA